MDVWTEDGPILTVISGEQVLYTVRESKDIITEFGKMAEGMSTINVNRGAGNIKGFYAEYVNVANDNIFRGASGINAREVVINNNGPADSAIKYQNGQTGRLIQDKCGYTKNQHMKFIQDGKYDGYIYRINSDNPILKDENFRKLCKEHNIKIEMGESEKYMNALGEIAKKEVKIKNALDISQSQNATITTKIYSVQKTLIEANLEVILPAAINTAAFSAGVSLSRHIYKYIDDGVTFGGMATETLLDAVLAGGMSWCVGNVGVTAASLLEGTKVTCTAEAITAGITGNNLVLKMGEIITAVMPVGVAPVLLAGVLVGTTVTSIKIAKGYLSQLKRETQEAKKYIRKCSECEKILKEQKEYIFNSIWEKYNDEKEAIVSAFERILDGIENDSVSSQISGLKGILSIVNGDVLFESSDDFYKCFNNSNYVFNI